MGHSIKDSWFTEEKLKNVSQTILDETIYRILLPFIRVGIFDIQNNNNITNNVTTKEHK